MDSAATEFGHRDRGVGLFHSVQQDRLVRLARVYIVQTVAAATGKMTLDTGIFSLDEQRDYSTDNGLRHIQAPIVQQLDIVASNRIAGWREKHGVAGQCGRIGRG